MAEGATGSSSAWKRFSGRGNSASADYKVWKRWMQAKISLETRRGLPKEAVGPMVYTLLDDDAERAVEHLEIADLEVVDGEALIFTALDERFPDREASDRVGDALESVFGSVIERGESSQAFTGRARTLFATAQKEGVDLPPVARGFLLPRGARFGPERRAIVLAASQRKWSFEDIAAALRTTYPKQMPSTQIHEVTTDEEAPAHVPVAFVGDDEGDDVTEAEINEILTEDNEPIEEEDAIDILATWKETRAAMNKERLQRGFKPQTNTKEALQKLEMRNRCFLCKRVGHFSRACPMRRSKGGGKGAPSSTSSMSSGSHQQRPAGSRPVGMVTVEVLMADPQDENAVDDDDAWQEIDMLLSTWSRDGSSECADDGDGRASLITKLTNAERFRRLARERREPPESDDNDHDDDENDDMQEMEVNLCHSPVCGAIDTGCGMCLIGSTTLDTHVKSTGEAPEYIDDAPTVRFKAYDGRTQRSSRACWLRWYIPKAGKIVRLMTYIVDGDAGLLISKPVLKMLRAQIKMDDNTLYLGALGTSVDLKEAKITGHYEVDLNGDHGEKEIVEDTPIDDSKVQIQDMGFQKGRVGALRPTC